MWKRRARKIPARRTLHILVFLAVLVFLAILGGTRIFCIPSGTKFSQTAGGKTTGSKATDSNYR
ncbi:hypothetical protein ACU19_05480 [Actinobaculum suis]|nr:hypothetical protein ACU19_05480 [Actinobaculum suis]